MSTIWKIEPEKLTLELLNQRGKNTMVEYLGIEISEIGDDYLQARMPVDHRTRQPLGILHGGASCVLAETVGSTAANIAVNLKTHYCVGLSIYTSHIRSAREGWLTGTAKPLHLGRSTHIWNIAISNEAGQLISDTRLTMAVLDAKER
jgi:1,4-dihydroxy-2-naphthoyl-CoA hydrolase